MERNLNALLVMILSVILLGAFGVQIFEDEQPCALCLLQRIGMICVGIGALLNVRFGIQKSHYALSLLSAIFGSFVALRQIALHVCPQFSKFGEPFWGISLYTWSFFIFASAITYIALLLFFFSKKENHKEVLVLNGFHKVAFGTLFAISIGNIIGTFFLCGLGAC